MKGKRVSTGSPGQRDRSLRVPRDRSRGSRQGQGHDAERLGVAESVNAIKDKKIDAFFWVGGLPTAAVTDLAATPGVKIKMIDIAHLVPTMNKKHGNLYVAGRDPERHLPAA